MLTDWKIDNKVSKETYPIEGYSNFKPLIPHKKKTSKKSPKLNQNKKTWDIPKPLSEYLYLKIVTTLNTGEDIMKQDHSYTPGRNHNGAVTLETFLQFL